MLNERIFITGGAGFLGSNVAKLLLNKNYKVTVFDDFSNGKMLHLEDLRDNPNIRIVKGNILDYEFLSQQMKNHDVILHLAVLDLRQSIKEPDKVNSVIVNGTLNCLNATLANKIPLFFNCSSSEAYGSAQYIPMDEKHPLLPETPYAAAKVAQDKYVYSYGRTYGLPWVTIRPFNMYGPNSHWQGFRGEVIPKMIVRAMSKKELVLFGNGEQTRDFIFVEEVANAIHSILNNKDIRNMEINVCSGKEVSMKRIAELICDNFQLDKSVYIKNKEPRPGDVKRHLGDNTRLKNLAGQTNHISIEEGIEKTIDWFKGLSLTSEELISQEKERNWE